MHPEAMEFVDRMVRAYDLADAEVVFDLGGADRNGTTRDLFDDPLWVAIDVDPDSDVDVAADLTDAVEVHHALRAWAGATGSEVWPVADVVLCTEVLEHVSDWPAVIRTALSVLAPGGHLILTAAGDGRPPHAADGSPGGPKPGEHYRNVPESQVRGVLAAEASVGEITDWQTWHRWPPGDTYAHARKVTP